MKKVSEMSGNERIAYRNIKHTFNNEVGGWYNCIQDGCEEYIPDTIEQAKKIVYEEALSNYSDTGITRMGKAPKEMRFAGKKFIEECIDYLFEHDGDVEEIKEVKGW